MLVVDIATTLMISLVSRRIEIEIENVNKQANIITTTNISSIHAIHRLVTSHSHPTYQSSSTVERGSSSCLTVDNPAGNIQHNQS